MKALVEQLLKARSHAAADLAVVASTHLEVGDEVTRGWLRAAVATYRAADAAYMAALFARLEAPLPSELARAAVDAAAPTTTTTPQASEAA